MRYFPSARQQLAAVIIGILALAAIVMPWAHADDDNELKQRRQQVKGQIGQAAHDLDEASAAAARARRSYDDAQKRLADARTRFDGVSQRLAEAREQDAAMRAQLEKARKRLAKADADLEFGQAETLVAKDHLRTSVLRSYDDTDLRLRAYSALLESGSLSDLTARLAVQDVVIGAGDRAFTTYQQTEAALEVQASEVKRATKAVEKRRQEAADHLETVRGLYGEAQSAKAEVQRLVGSARAIKQKALQVQARDKARLAALKQREANIKQRLVELARRERARAARSGGGFSGTSGGFLTAPARARVTSPYGYRTHPIYGYYGLHNGIDFGAGCGQALYAGADGTVIDTYYDDVYGNRLFLNVGMVNGKNLVLVYNHLSGYNVREGARVSRGSVVGYAGDTGWSTGCHLHFTTLANGRPVDPQRYL